MSPEVGFIIRTASWEKKYDYDLFISTEGLQAGDVKTVYYVAGDSYFRESFEAFNETIVEFDYAMALDNHSVEVRLSAVLPSENVMFTVTDRNGNPVEINKVNPHPYNDRDTRYVIVFSEQINPGLYPLTITLNGESSIMCMPDAEVILDIIGSRNVTLEVGDTYNLPYIQAFSTTPFEETELRNIYLFEGYDFVDTREVGTYELYI